MTRSESFLLQSALFLSLVMVAAPSVRAEEASIGLENANLIDDAVPLLLEAQDGAETWPSTIHGVVLDETSTGIANAGVVINGHEFKTDASGSFNIPGGSADTLIIKKPGFRKTLVKPTARDLRIYLSPQVINGVYVQSGIFQNKNSPVMQNVMSLVKTTELNAMVVDVKDDDGLLSRNLKNTIDEMHAKGLYLIARIVTFKDNVAPRKHPELALIDSRTNAPWQDKHHITYLNPMNPKAREYVINVAKDAVSQGFDEIEFDYVRFPTDGERKFVVGLGESTPETRTEAIKTFLSDARRELGAMGAFIAADVFGDTAYVKTDSGIGQRVEDITPFLDYVCPMVYPSGFAKNTAVPGVPTDHPKEVIEDSIKRYRLRADSETVIRPWLQAFRDYAYDHVEYGASQIRAQIDGSDAVGGQGFLLWNASNHYSNAGLKSKKEGRNHSRHSNSAQQVKK